MAIFVSVDLLNFLVFLIKDSPTTKILGNITTSVNEAMKVEEYSHQLPGTLDAQRF